VVGLWQLVCWRPHWPDLLAHCSVLATDVAEVVGVVGVAVGRLAEDSVEWRRRLAAAVPEIVGAAVAEAMHSDCWAGSCW
jgi:hypothetical protein